jgi:flagellar biosynthesis protein FlhA
MDRIVRCHAAEILTREEVSRLVADIRERAPALVEELIPSVLKLGEVHKVLQNLLREQVSIRNLELILEALADHGDEAKDPVQLTDCVRRVLGRAICSPLATRDGVLHAALLDPVLEEFLQSSVEKADRGTRLAVEPEMVETLVESIAGVLSRMEQAGVPAVLVCSGMIRAHIRALAARRLPQASVLAYDEVPDDFRLEVHGSVALEKVC